MSSWRAYGKHWDGEGENKNKKKKNGRISVGALLERGVYTPSPRAPPLEIIPNGSVGGRGTQATIDKWSWSFLGAKVKYGQYLCVVCPVWMKKDWLNSTDLFQDGCAPRGVEDNNRRRFELLLSASRMVLWSGKEEEDEGPGRSNVILLVMRKECTGGANVLND